MSTPEDEPQQELRTEEASTEEQSTEPQIEPQAEQQTTLQAEPQTAETPDEKAREVRLPSMFWALVPILCMAALMIYVFGWVADSDTYDAAHLPLLCSIVVACIVGIAYGRSFKYMLEGIIERLLVSMEAILILLLVGLLISSFMISGTIPALIYYGLALLTPQTFLPIGCIICAVVGWACGSSWSSLPCASFECQGSWVWL